MPLPKSLAVVVLLLLSVAFAGANLWFSAVRSTIPLHLDSYATHKERLIEKTPGVDDVYVVRLGDNTNLQVDGSIFEAIAPNCRVRKDAWSRKPEIDDKIIKLEWSPDFKRMALAMPAVIVLCVVCGFVAIVNR